MRLALLLTLALLAPAFAQAQTGAWQPYSYGDRGFAFASPSAPVVDDAKTETWNGQSAPVRTYAAEAPGIVYTLSVVDLTKQTLDGPQTIAEAERRLSALGKVTVAVDARINREYGRELNIEARDGSRLTTAIFFIDGRLYRLVANALPPDAQARSGDALRFQQSLQFIPVTAASATVATADVPVPVQGRGGGGRRGGFGGGGGFGRGGGGAQAQAACAGKAAGDKVQLDTPQGPVAATCTLIARPDRPPGPPQD